MGRAHFSNRRAPKPLTLNPKPKTVKPGGWDALILKSACLAHRGRTDEAIRLLRDRMFAAQACEESAGRRGMMEGWCGGDVEVAHARLCMAAGVGGWELGIKNVLKRRLCLNP